MRVHGWYRIVLAACLGAVLLLVSAAPALAAPESHAPRMLSALPRVPASGTGSLRTTALPPGWSIMDQPMGSQYKGSLTGGGGKIVAIPLYAGQKLHLELRGSNPQEWEMDLWNDYVDSEEPVAYTYTGYPLKIDYTAVSVVADYGEGMQSYDWSWHLLYIFPPDTGGTYTLSWTITDPPVTTSVHRIAGANRFETSADTAEWAFSATDTAVVATGRNFADALAASSLCGSYGAPLLLTDTNVLPPAIKSTLTGLGVKTVFIVGDTKAVSASVQSAIDALPGVETSRVAGSDRYRTAVAIAQKVLAHELAMGRTPATEAFVASGKDFPDALAVSPYAYSQRMPILLTAPTYLPPATASAIGALGIASVHVVGGTGSVGTAPYASIPGAKDRTIAGLDRADTSRIAGDFAVARGWATWSQVGIATGWNYPDALGGGVATGAKNGVLLLTKPLFMTDPTFNALWDNRAGIDDVAVFGGPTTVAGFVMGNADEMLSDTGFFNDFRTNAALDTDNVTHISANGPSVTVANGMRTLDTTASASQGAADVWKNPVPAATSGVFEVMVKPTGTYADQCGLTFCNSATAPATCAASSTFPASIMYAECQYTGSRDLVAAYMNSAGAWRYLTVSSTWGTLPGKCGDWVADTVYVLRYEFTPTQWRCGWYAADGTTVVRQSPWVNRSDTKAATALYPYCGDPYTDLWSSRSQYLYYRRY